MTDDRTPKTSRAAADRRTTAPLDRRGFLAGGAAGLAALALTSVKRAEAAEAGPHQDRQRFADRIVLITGATSGIGEATARAFAAEGARVFFGGRRQARGEEPQVAAFVRGCVQAYGGLDIAFNNAGIEGPEGTYDEIDLEGTNSYRDVLRTNLDGVFFAMRHEIPVMRERRRGVIINTASIQGSQGGAESGPYSASKHAVIGLTRSAALAHAEEGLRILSISPGAVDTPLLRRMYDGELEPIAENIPMGRIAQPREIAAMVLNLASPEASFLTGADVKVDGGTTA